MKPAVIALGLGAAYLGYLALKKKPVQYTTVGEVATAAVGPSRFPSWKNDRLQIMAKAQEIWSRGNRATDVRDRFSVTRDTLVALWPKLPWPQTIADQLPLATPGAPGVFEQRWVVVAGPTGNALKAVWDPTAEFVDDLVARFIQK